MNISRVRTSILITLSGALILSAAGCEDSAAKQRDEVRVQLAQIRSELQKTIATGGDSYDKSLNQIVTRLGTISGGEPGQQSAKALLAADALREIAAIHMNVAATIETQQRADIGVVNARIDAAHRLQSLASGLDTLDGAKRRAELQAELQKAKDSVTALQSKIAELESPINERNAQNTQQKQAIERLRLQVGDLLKKAQDMGYSSGLATYKEATDLGRQADKIEFEVSNREIDLEHDLNPQHKMAQTQMAQVEALAQSIETAQGELDAFSKAASGDAQTSRAKAAEINKEITDGLAQIKSQADGPLKAAYDEALAALGKAATNARTAATGGDANAAKMIGAAVSESIARVHLSAAQGIAAREATLQRIKSSNGAVTADGVDAQIKELAAAYKENIDAAKTALEEAKQAADTLPGNSAAVQGFQGNLNALIDSVSGTKPPPPPPSASGGDDSSSSGAAATSARTPPAGTGAASPEALVETLKSIKTMQDAGKIFTLVLPPSDPQLQGVLNNLQEMFSGVSALDTALQAKFSKGVLDLNSAGTGDMAMIADATLVDSNETGGHVKITDTKGKTNVAPISIVDGRWFIGAADDDSAGFAALGMGGPEGAAASPEAAQMAKGMMVAMSGMFTAMGKAMSDLAKSVEAGEFASFDDFKTKSELRMQEVMQKSMGMPGLTPPATPGATEPGK